MKIKVVIFVLVILLVIGISLNSMSTSKEKIPPSNNINIDNIINNSEDYSITKIKNIESTAEYIEILKNDKNIEESMRESLINKALITDTHYLMIQLDIPVTSSYHCYPYFYCSTLTYEGTSTPNQILSIDYANIDQSYNNTSKQFSGNFYYNLESGNQIYWDLNGDFYNDGVTTVSMNDFDEMKGDGLSTFSVLYSSDHYAYKQISGRYKLDTTHP